MAEDDDGRARSAAAAAAVSTKGARKVKRRIGAIVLASGMAGAIGMPKIGWAFPELRSRVHALMTPAASQTNSPARTAAVLPDPAASGGREARRVVSSSAILGSQRALGAAAAAAAAPAAAAAANAPSAPAAAFSDPALAAASAAAAAAPTSGPAPAPGTSPPPLPSAVSGSTTPLVRPASPIAPPSARAPPGTGAAAEAAAAAAAAATTAIGLVQLSDLTDAPARPPTAIAAVPVAVPAAKGSADPSDAQRSRWIAASPASVSPPGPASNIADLATTPTETIRFRPPVADGAARSPRLRHSNHAAFSDEASSSSEDWDRDELEPDPSHLLNLGASVGVTSPVGALNPAAGAAHAPSQPPPARRVQSAPTMDLQKWREDALSGGTVGLLMDDDPEDDASDRWSRSSSDDLADLDDDALALRSVRPAAGSAPPLGRDTRLTRTAATVATAGSAAPAAPAAAPARPATSGALPSIGAALALQTAPAAAQSSNAAMPSDSPRPASASVAGSVAMSPWLVPSVQAKASQHRKRVREKRRAAQFESWDDDFDDLVVDDSTVSPGTSAATGQHGQQDSAVGIGIGMVGAGSADNDDTDRGHEAGFESGSDMGEGHMTPVSAFRRVGGHPGRRDVSEARSLAIPPELMTNQRAIRADLENMRRFALHVEDLKLVWLDVQDQLKGLVADHPAQVEQLKAQYQTSLRQVQALIELGELTDEHRVPTMSTIDMVAVLRGILKDDTVATTNTAGAAGGASGGSHHPGVPPIAGISPHSGLMPPGTAFSFGVHMIPQLLRSVAPLKAHLASVQAELRSLALSEPLAS
ncbi:hypothetical protein CXG81DRAFT_23847 [Caulochytrium protostelioides]|uniref:Uncharacterized protein n=1 Tax=Caulochytrium protostelioides TaxID=1555241 RepID=A0A4V1IVC6_9FUNG|nr:hypothetical protein CXG81DRAFT_23847 [Caulochytrium protostelioides]|eukprot:RKP03589.1 hypothetical protein CXG81DRAFT_23847 [Caulochytrium protostelioides]